MKYPRYAQYRDSGVEWLGEVPAHWEVDRLKWSTNGCVNGVWGAEADGGDDDVVCVRVADFDRVAFRVDLNDPTLRSVTTSERKSRLLQHGDLLLEKSGGGSTQPVGVVVQFDHPESAVTSNFVARMAVADKFDSGFLTYLHAHLYASRVNTRSIKQTTGIQNLDSHAYLDELVCYPPLNEQRAIAAYLDRETVRIDALIETKRRFIALLHEKRAALIGRAVTCGLDPAAPTRASGVAWLRRVPKHWKVLPLKRAIRFQRGHDLPADDRNEGKFCVISSAGHSGHHDEAIAKAPGITTGRYGTIGEFSYITQDYWPLNTVLYSIEMHGNDVRFLWWMLHVLKPLFLVNSQKSAVPGVDRNDLHPELIALPPVQEQREIAGWLDVRVERIDSALAKVVEAIQKLEQYRSVLIGRSVVGAIRVGGEG